jgi:hypothetical protein
MLDQAPVRRHVDISARTGAQLELRLHWFGSALTVRSGYIVAVHRRSCQSGRHVASIAYEMPLPQYARPPRKARAPLAPGIGHDELGNSGAVLQAARQL